MLEYPNLVRNASLQFGSRIHLACGARRQCVTERGRVALVLSGDGGTGCEVFCMACIYLRCMFCDWPGRESSCWFAGVTSMGNGGRLT